MEILLFITLLCLLVLFYHFVGYPLLLALLAKVWQRPVAQSTATPSVSLIIAAYNEGEIIRSKIENSLELDYPPGLLEIIVISDGSTDETAAVVETFAGQGVKSMHMPARNGKSAAVNRAVAQAQHEIVVVSDANAYYLPDAIRKLVRNFGDPEVGGVSGRKTIRKSGSPISESEGTYWKYESFIKKQESLLDSTAGVVGEMMAVRRSLFQPIPAAIILDDAYTALNLMRRGYRVIYEPAAVCWETSAASSRDEFIRRRRNSAGRYQFLFEPAIWPWNKPIALFAYLSHKLLRLVLPIFMIVALGLSTVAMLLPQRTPLITVAFVLQLIFYGLAALGLGTEHLGKRFKLAAIAYYIASGTFSSLPGLFYYLSGKQTPVWEKVQRS